MMDAIELSEPEQGSSLERSDVVGIDLGTTNSLIGVCEGDQPQMLQDAAGKALIPSAVYCGKDGLLVGNAALVAARRPERLLTSTKRLLGLDADAFAKACDKAGYQHTVVDGVNHIVAGGRKLSPVEVNAEILGMLMGLAHKRFGHDPDGCVITVPAYFGERQRQAVRLAARLQGIQLMRLLDEPTAAAIAYGLDHDSHRQALVYDLGGGTFDVSVIRLHEGVFEVLAIGGDDSLGGDDFDALLVEWLHKSTSTSLDEIAPGALMRKARQAKEMLSSLSMLSVDLDEFGIDECPELSVDDYERVIQPLVAKTLAITADTLDQAGVEATALDRIILAGGATRTPLVYRMLAESFGQEILDSIDPEQVVAIGASLHAAQLAGKLPNRHLLLGVLPLSLGIETMGGMVEVVLARNTTLPARAVQVFTTHQNNQTGMKFHIVQGEREMSHDCRSLARFELKRLPPAPAGLLRIELSFEVDADGLLSATAREPVSGSQVNVEVRPSSGLDDDRVSQMLQSSYANAEADHRRRLLGEQRLAAETEMAAAEALIAKPGRAVASLKEGISRQCQRLGELLDTEDYDSIAEALSELNRQCELLLDSIMDEGFEPQPGPAPAERQAE